MQPEWQIEGRAGIAVGTRVGLTPPATGGTTTRDGRVRNTRVGNVAAIG